MPDFERRRRKLEWWVGRKEKELLALSIPPPPPRPPFPLISTNTFAPGLLSRQTETLEKGAISQTRNILRAQGAKSIKEFNSAKIRSLAAQRPRQLRQKAQFESLSKKALPTPSTAAPSAVV